MQGLLSMLIVAACAGYVLWTLLLPAGVKQRVFRALGRQPAVRAEPGCGACDGCARRRPPGPAPEQAVHWMRRQR